jgi:cyclopropane fatty-acyl-phospholipid synthase-like methyltransferase
VKHYSKSEKYDKNEIEENWMGPNPLYLAEELCANLKLECGMKVLDLGCGKGLTSIYLAEEFGVTVFAVDLWINPTDNLKRFNDFGVADYVFPISSEAHTLPFAEIFSTCAIAEAMQQRATITTRNRCVRIASIRHCRSWR